MCKFIFKTLIFNEVSFSGTSSRKGVPLKRVGERSTKFVTLNASRMRNVLIISLLLSLRYVIGTNHTLRNPLEALFDRSYVTCPFSLRSNLYFFSPPPPPPGEQGKDNARRKSDRAAIRLASTPTKNPASRELRQGTGIRLRITCCGSRYATRAAAT